MDENNGMDDSGATYDDRKPPPKANKRTGLGTCSGLVRVATQLTQDSDMNILLVEELACQQNVRGETNKAKEFWLEVLHQTDLVVFVFMKANSPFLQLVHLRTVYHLKGADQDLKCWDIAFMGDKTTEHCRYQL